MTSLFLWAGGGSARLARWLLTLAAGCLVLGLGGATWMGSWKVALDWGTGTLILVGPVCAGICALTYSTMSSRRWDLLVAGMRRGYVAWLGPMLGVWVLGLAVMLACTGVVLATASALGANASPTMLWAVPLVSMTLAAQVGIGAVVGASLPRAFSVPLAVVTTFLLETLSVSGTIPGIFRTGGVTGPLAGETYDFSVLRLQALVCIATAAACALSLAFHIVLVRSSVALFAVLGALALAIPPWWALESTGHDRYIPEPSPRLVCKGNAPRVCLSADTVRPLDGLSREMNRQAEPLLELGIEIPDRFVQSLPGARHESDGLVIFVDAGATAATIDPRTVSLALATPRACPQFFSKRAPVRALRSRGVLADWIATENNVPGIGVSKTSREGRWLNRPVSEQAAWLSSTYAALSDCRLNDLTVPFRR